MRPSTLADLLRSAVARFGSRPSLIFSGQRHGFDELEVEAGRFASWLQDIGLMPDDRVTPPTGVVVIAPPLKIVNSSGSPLRVLALAPA